METPIQAKVSCCGVIGGVWCKGAGLWHRWVQSHSMSLKKPASCPSKPRGPPGILQRRGYLCSSSEPILLLALGTPRKPFPESASLGSQKCMSKHRPSGRFATCPFPDRCSCLLGQGNHREGLRELGLELLYGQLKKNRTSGKEISAKQGKLLCFFSPSTSRRTFNSV